MGARGNASPKCIARLIDLVDQIDPALRECIEGAAARCFESRQEIVAAGKQRIPESLARDRDSLEQRLGALREAVGKTSGRAAQPVDEDVAVFQKRLG